MFAIFSSLIRATLLAILSSLIKVKVYTVILRKQSDQGLHYLPCSAVWSGSTLFVILSLIRVYTICHPQQSDQCLHYLLNFLRIIIKGYTAIRSSLISVYTLVGWLCWGLTSQSTIFQSCRDGAIASWVINQYFRGVKCLAQGHNTAAVGLEPRTSRSRVRHSTTEPPRSPVCTLLAILSSLIRVYTVCHSQQSDQGLLYLPVSAVWLRSRSTLSFSGTIWSGSTLYAILSSLISVDTICRSQHSDQSLHFLPFSAFWPGLHYFPFSAVWWGSILFAILSSLIRIYTVCHSQQSYQSLHYLPFSAV